MANIDDKVVAISFESSKFEHGVQQTISALDKLKAALHFPTAGKGLADINAAAQKVDLSHISNGVDKVRTALDSLRLVAIGVFSQLATQAVRAAGSFIKSFTFEPIKQGFQEYETNIKSIQTILSNTQAAGTTLKDVTASLKELNEYSDKTIYNFAEMAKNIGTFTAAGVGLKDSTSAIKGIANLAALSGSTSEQASRAMYQLSQAISAGRVSMIDWISVRNAGMGGSVFQRALAQTAEAMGTLKKGAVDLVGPMKNVKINGEAFTQSITARPGKTSWLTSDVLVKTLAQFTGDLKDAELAAMGFNDAQIAAIQKTAQTALFAATKVKTFTDLVSTTKEQIATGWADSFAIIFGGYHEATKLFTGLSQSIGAIVSKNADARNKILGDWKALGGRTLLIHAIGQAFHALGDVVGVVKEAFHDIFPPITGKRLFELTQGFARFTESLRPSETTLANLKRTFAGLFAIFSIVGQIIGGIIGVFARLFGVVGEGTGSFLDFTGGIGDFLVSVDKALKKGDGLGKFFDGLGNILEIPIRLIGELASAIGNLFDGFDSGKMGGMAKAMSPLESILHGIASAWNKFTDAIADIDVARAVEAISSAIQGLGDAIGNAASGMNFEAIFAVIRTGLFAGLIYMLKNFFGKGSFLDQISKGFAGGIIGNISGSFKALEKTMVGLQQNIKAKTLKEIAIAIALLALSVVALSFVDPAKLNTALGAIAIMMGELLGAMAILNKIAMTGGFIKLPIIAAGLIILAGAIDLLVIAVFALSKLSWEELLKGLAGVGALLAGLSAASIVLSANSGGMIRAGIGIAAIAIAMNLLALAMKQFAGMSWQEIGKGLTGVAGALVVIAGAMKVMPKSMVLQGAALIAIAVGLKILASAIAQFGTMDWSVIGKGLLGIGGALVIIAGAMQLMPKGMVLQAAALLLLSVALGKIADVVQDMGGMSLGEIARGLGTLAGALIILAAALYVMSGTLAGAAALAIAAAGLALLVPAIVALGGMSWGSILKGLVTLAAALTIIGIAGALITPVIPSLLGLGAALLLIGVGLALAGAGIFLIATGLSALVVALPTGIGVIIAALKTLTQAAIENAKLIALGIVEIAQALADTAPEFVEAIVKILGTLLDGIITLAPKLEEAINALITVILNVLDTNIPRIVQSGMNIVIALLEGIRDNIPTIVSLIYQIIGAIVTAIFGRLPTILAAGGRLLREFTTGILSRIAEVPAAAIRIMTSFVTGIIGRLGTVVTAGATIVTRFVASIISGLGKLVTSGISLITSLVQGITSGTPRVVAAALNAAARFISSIASGLSKLATEGTKAIGNLVRGITGALGTAAGTVRGVAANVGRAIIQGMTGGLTEMAGDLYAKIEGVMNKAMDLMHRIPGVKSPSTVTTEIGRNIVRGLSNGINAEAPNAYSAAETVSRGVVGKIHNVFGTEGKKGSKVLFEIGRYVVTGFRDGLSGMPEEIKKVYAELNTKLLEAGKAARETLASEQKKLKELMAADKQDADAIKKAQDVIAQNQRILAVSVAGHNALNGALKANRTELMGIARQYEMVSNTLKLAQDKLKELEQERVDLIKSLREQYATLPDITTEGADGEPIDPLAAYQEALRLQIEAVAKYSETLQQLRELGLDDETYNKLLAEGPEAQAFATQLLSGGKTAVESLNELDRQLRTESEKLAVNAANNLKKAGIDAAAGLIAGLKSQKGRLIREMEEMADEIVAAFNRRLKARSPSRVFMEAGAYAMEGLAIGISNSIKTVTGAVEDAADAAINAMKSTLSKVSDTVLGELNANPVITPILDLTQVRAQAGELGALTSVTPITAAASYGQAALISAEQLAAQGEQIAASPLGGTSVKFEQNNYSPESLTEIEIYRQTKNQLSQLKSALSLT